MCKIGVYWCIDYVYCILSLTKPKVLYSCYDIPLNTGGFNMTVGLWHIGMVFVIMWFLMGTVAFLAWYEKRMWGAYDGGF